jgi:hypothetical protein
MTRLDVEVIREEEGNAGPHLVSGHKTWLMDASICFLHLPLFILHLSIFPTIIVFYAFPFSRFSLSPLYPQCRAPVVPTPPVAIAPNLSKGVSMGHVIVVAVPRIGTRKRQRSEVKGYVDVPVLCRIGTNVTSSIRRRLEVKSSFADVCYGE